MHEPKLLLLDEPTAGVDPQARRDFWDEIHRLSDEGLTVLVSTHYMDEAERCHEIAYIFNGDLIARGTADQVIEQSKLVTFEAEGPRADRLSRDLVGKPGVEMIAPFGAALHVSGNDREQLEAAIEPFRRDPWRWTEVSPSLEDVFIHLMRERGGQQAQQDAAAA
jgi:ABC-2 type transport system ATP-binding protein